MKHTTANTFLQSCTTLDGVKYCVLRDKDLHPILEASNFGILEAAQKNDTQDNSLQGTLVWMVNNTQTT